MMSPLNAVAHPRTVYTQSVPDWDPDLFWNMMPVPGFQRSIVVARRSHLFVTGHIDVQHRGVAGTANQSIGAAFEVRVNGNILPGSTTGANMTNSSSDAYYTAYIHGYKVLEPGSYTIDVYGRSYSSVAPGVDGLAEVKGGYNEVLYIVEDVGG